MKRLLPQSLLGQVMLVLAIGLMVGQAISAVLLYRAAEQRRETALVSALAFRLIAEGDRPGIEERQARRMARREERIARGMPVRDEPGRPFARRLRFGVERTEIMPIGVDEPRFSDYEEALREVLTQQDVVVGYIIVTRRIAGDDPFVQKLMEDRPRMRGPGWEERGILVAAVQRADETGWLVARIAEPRAPRNAIGTIAFQTLVIFAILFALLYFVLRRMTRPLAALTARVSDFSRQPDRAVLIEESGPADMRRLIAAHNTMETRIAALLDEKDVMLGAIGHDLKTPLAALRVRIESVPDETQRERMAASIEDITETLDDILALARIGRSDQPPERVDLSALAASVVEEFEDLGEPVELGETTRLIAPVQVTWAKRALRNLVSNAVRYGKAARVSLVEDGDEIVLRVDDDGPGIPAGEIEAMLEPFTRGETSRNRATGGAGLGLTLARAIAEQHGGTLKIANREDEGQVKGLRAEIRLPKG
ncbi:MAG: ATP-binding protein [Pseudomonadota bacterium]